jgi:hypothetical protein
MGRFQLESKLKLPLFSGFTIVPFNFLYAFLYFCNIVGKSCWLLEVFSVSWTDGKISVRIKIEIIFIFRFHRRPIQLVVFVPVGGVIEETLTTSKTCG